MFTLRNSIQKLMKLNDLQLLQNIILFEKHRCYSNFLNINIHHTIPGISKYESTKVPDNKHEDSSQSEPFNYNEITKGDSTLEHKLKVIMMEMELLRQDGKPVPETSEVKKHHWNEILSLPSRSGRKKYFEFLFKVARTKENREVKKEQKRAEMLSLKNEPKKDLSFEEFVSTYDLSHNSIFLRIYESTMNQMYNNRLVQAMQFGQKLVVDCGYHENMTTRENVNCAKQLMLLFAENRAHDDPYDLHFCNCNPEKLLMQSLHRHIATLYEKWFPLNVNESSYLELFPKENLIYLTPHCREEMKEYDHDAVYIIGGIVDKVNQEPLSLAKAKQEGIRMQKFPLDRYLQWGGGSGKSLTLNQVASILLDVKHTGDWKHALRHVPKRKLGEHNPNPSYQQRNNNRFDSSGRKKWTPVSNSNFDNLAFNRDNNTCSSSEYKFKRRVSISSILKDE